MLNGIRWQMPTQSGQRKQHIGLLARMDAQLCLSSCLRHHQQHIHIDSRYALFRRAKGLLPRFHRQPQEELKNKLKRVLDTLDVRYDDDLAIVETNLAKSLVDFFAAAVTAAKEGLHEWSERVQVWKSSTSTLYAYLSD